MILGRLQALRNRMSLSQRFAATGGLVMLLTMTVIGLWVTHAIRNDVIENTAQATALYLDSFIAPLAQELAHSDTLSIGPSQAIEELLSSSELGSRIVGIKIWKIGGLVAYSNEPAILGRRFQPSSSLDAAFNGVVAAEFDDLSAEENLHDRNGPAPLLEIYSPLRQAYSGRILGAVEIYETAAGLEASLATTLLQTWALVAAITLVVFGTLFGIVHGASTLIGQQEAKLRARVVEKERMSEQNRLLRLRAAGAARRVSEINEKTLRHLSAELHDGPKQLIGLASLRLGALAKDGEARPGADMQVVTAALEEAMRTINLLCMNLATPKVEGLSVAEIIRKAAATHIFRTNSEVALDIGDLPTAAPESVCICIHRFLQEALNNAFWHSGGADQRVTCRFDGTDLSITVSNGPGPPTRSADAAGGGLGLAAMRDRIESLGGKFAFRRLEDGSAMVEMRIETDVEEQPS